MTDRNRLLDLIDRMGDATVVLFGDLVLDRFILGTPKRISREAPVIILRHEGQRDIAGGGANALANLHALGVRALPVGAVGDDEPGTALVRTLADSGLDIGRVVRVSGYRTPTKVRILGGGSSSLKHQVARYDIEDQLPSDGGWRVDLLVHLEQAVAAADAVAVSDYGYGTVTRDALTAMRHFGSRPPWTCLDSRYRLRELSPVDGATPNLQELEAWAGRPLHDDESVAAAAEELRHELDARFLLATRGHRGVTLVEPARPALHLPVYGTDEVADVTGAGDTVLAVLTAALAAGATPTDGATLANIAGGIVVMKLGTATVTRDELRHAVASSVAKGSS
jgi:rfaE bifunctional protein kinase chain/domain